MSRIHFKCEATQLVLTGNTFGVKETIKTLGGQWDAARRVWTLPLEMDTDETRTRLGALTKQQEEVAQAATAAWREAVLKAEKESRAKAAKKWEKRRAAEAAKNLELVQWCLADTSGKYTWVCCDKCEIVDFKNGHTSCKVHAHWDGQSWCSFRIFGTLYTGN
jgi:hypothetical protein